MDVKTFILYKHEKIKKNILIYIWTNGLIFVVIIFYKIKILFYMYYHFRQKLVIFSAFPISMLITFL